MSEYVIYETWSHWVKTRSPGQILEKPCVLSRRHSFDPVFMKLCQNIYLHEIYVKYDRRSHWLKTRSPGQILVHFRGHSFNAIFMQLCQNVFFSIKSRTGPKLGHVRSKTKSPGQILEKFYVIGGRHSFGPVLMKLCQNVYRYKIYVHALEGTVLIQSL